MYARSLSCLTLCNIMNCNPPGFSVGGILKARILERVAISSFRRFPPHRDLTHVFCIGRWTLYHWATWEAHLGVVFSLVLDSHVPIMLHYSFSNMLLFLLPQVLCTCCDLDKLHGTLKVVSQGCFLLILQSSTSLAPAWGVLPWSPVSCLPIALFSQSTLLTSLHGAGHNSSFYSNSFTCCLMSSSFSKL